MAKPRKHQICLDATPYYHCTSRCVRRAFLCGFDSYSGKSYEHRRQWVEDRILLLGSIFCIDVCAYAVMSNHHHVVLHINKAEETKLSDKQICLRWHKLYKGTLLTHKFIKNEELTEAELLAVKEKTNQWRLNLTDISWYMRALNEPIARMANEEDKCSGSFWESRFKSQALLDEKALATCMAYVDLNPVRAKMAKTPEESEHTSIKKRVTEYKAQQRQPKSLAVFVGNPRNNMPDGLPFHLKDYIELVDVTGRAIRENKRGHIESHHQPILERLGIEEKDWLILTTQFESRFNSVVGAKQTIKNCIQQLGYRRSPPTSLLLN